MKFSRQEERIVLLRISGLNDRAVAEELGLTLDTVRSYWKRIRVKMDGQTRAQIIAGFTRASSRLEIDAIKAEADLLKKEIEKRRKVERLLRESECKYRALFEHALDAIFLIDDHRCFVEVNPAMACLLGYERHEMIGQTFEKFVYPDDVEKSRKIRKRTVKNGIWEGNFSMLHRNGSRVDLRFRSMFNVVPNQVLGVAVPIRRVWNWTASAPFELSSDPQDPEVATI